MIEFIEEPYGGNLRSLIEHAGASNFRGLFVIRHNFGLEAQGAKLVTDISPYLTEQKETSEWPGTRLAGGTALVLSFKLPQLVCDRLKSAIDHLFGWRQPSLPEDLCFVREDGTPWLVTIAHEEDGYLFMDDVEREELLRTMPEMKNLIKED